MSRRTTIGMRRRILQLHRQGRSNKVIADTLSISYFQVYNVVGRRVKTNYSPRADKGTKRETYVRTKSVGEVTMKKLTQCDNIYDFLQAQLMQALGDLQKRKLNAADRVKVLKDVSYIQRNIKTLELEEYIQRPDALLIARIMRRFDHSLSDDDIIKVYREEYEKLKADQGA